MHRHVNGDQRGAGDGILVKLLDREIEATHLGANLAEPGGGRGEPERLTTKIVKR